MWKEFSTKFNDLICGAIGKSRIQSIYSCRRSTQRTEMSDMSNDSRRATNITVTNTVNQDEDDS